MMETSNQFLNFSTYPASIECLKYLEDGCTASTPLLEDASSYSKTRQLKKFMGHDKLP
jgi:hypothetical protein